MRVRHWGVRFALGTLLFASVLACQITDTFLAQATVAPTKTKTPKPTFTLIPPPTSTPVPPPPTVAPLPTTKPTVKPTTKPVPTKPPPTKPPPPPPPVAGPTTSPYEWHANAPGCEHSGITHIKARVYAGHDADSPGAEGVRVALGGPDGRSIWDKVTTTWDGTYTFILSESGQPGREGTWYLWLVDSKDNRISDIGGPVRTNNLGPDDPNACWHGWVDFWK